MSKLDYYTQLPTQFTFLFILRNSRTWLGERIVFP